jgi:DNA (cytosine-5)-methyltransferase 1
LNELALFAGAGGGLLASSLLGWTTACAVEINPYCIDRLQQRQNEGHLEPFPIWDDIHTFRGHPWNGKIDIITGGFPCQAFSTATHGESTAVDLWPQMRRIINEVRPSLVFGENVSIKAIGRAAKECECDGYKTQILALSSGDVGGNYPGLRYWFLATSDMRSELLSAINVQTRGVQKLYPRIWDAAPEGWQESLELADARQGCGGSKEARQVGKMLAVQNGSASKTESSGLGMADGVASRLDRYSAIGNGQVPAVAATAFCILADSFGNGATDETDVKRRTPRPAPGTR